MRNLNFLRKSERKSVGTTLALTVGSPSAHRRYSALKHLAFMLLFLLGSLNVWGAVSTLTFTAACGGSGTADDNVAWTVTSDGTESSFDNTKGIHYGTGSAQVKYIRLSTSGITGTITQIVVNASAASGVSATVGVTVGGDAFGGDPKTISSTATGYTFTGSASGAIVVEVTKPSKAAKAIYCKSIAVTYSTGGTVNVTNVALDESAITLTEDDTQTLTATVLPDNATNKNVTWESDDEDVATVEDGVVTAVGEGDATITCKSVADPTKYAECAVHVNPSPYTKSTLIFTGKYSDNGATADDDAEWEVTSDGTESNYDGISGIHYGTNSANVTYLQLATSDITGEVAKVVVNARDAQATATISVTVGGTAFTCASATATNTSADYVFTGTGSGEIVVRVDRGSSMSKAIYVKSVVVSYIPAAVEVKKPAFSIAGGTYTTAQSVGLSCETEGATIYYTTDGSVPDNTSTEYTGAISLSDRGTYTIKAIAIKGLDESAVATATYTINPPFASVAELFAYLDAHSLTSLNDVTVSGYVSEIVTEYSTQHSNITFNISDDGSTTTAQLQSYRGVGTDASIIEAGDKVTISGNYTVHSTTRELAAGNTITNRIAKGAVTAVAVSGTPTKTEYVSGEAFEPAGLVVTATYANGFATAVTPAEWLFDPETVTASGNIEVIASFGGQTSDVYNVPVTVAAKTLVSIAATPTSYTIYKGQALPEPTIMATYSEGEPADVSVEAIYDTESVFDNTTADTYTITVSYTFGTTETTTYEVTVEEYANADDAPYTVTEALDIIVNAIGAIESADEIVVAGTVSEEKISNYKNRYKISDGDKELLVYNGKGFNKESFTDDNYPKEGDVVVVKGNVINYNGNTPEFATGKSYLLSQVRPATLAIEDVASLEVGADDLAEGDLDITTPSDGDITFVSGDDTKATIVANAIHAVAPGTVTITANLAATENVDALNYAATSTTFSVTVVAPATKYAITFDGNGNTGGSAPEAIADKASGEEVTLPANSYTKTGYTFTGWKVYDENEDEVTVTANAFTMPASPVTIKAQWAALPIWATTYSSNITVGTDIVKFSDELEAPEYAAKKAGTGSAYGSTTVTVPVSTSKLHFHAVCYGADTYAVTLKVKKGDNVLGTFNINKDTGAKGSSPFILANTPYEQYYSVTLADITEPTTITFEAESGSEKGKRFIIFGVNQEGGLVPVLDHIEIAGDLTTKSGYKAGDAIDMDGLTVSATYTLGGTPQTPVDITEDVALEWSYDPLVEGQENVTITASYKGQTDDIEITLDEPVASADPLIITDPTTYLNWGTIIKDATAPTKTITVTLQNVTAATAVLGGTNSTAFTIDDTEIADGDVITVSVASTATVGVYSAKVILTDNAGLAPNKEINLSLTIEDAETPVSTTSQWVAATAADLVDGVEVLIVGVHPTTSKVYAAGEQGGNNRAAVEASVDGEGVLTPGDNTMSFILEAQEGGKFALRTSNGKYLCAASSGNNYLRTQDVLDDNGKWTLTTTSAVANGSYTRNTMFFNSSSSLFACYASSTTTQQPIAFYVPKAIEPEWVDIRPGATSGKYYTVCLSKKVVDFRGGNFWSMSKRGDGIAYLEEATGTLPAGTPYIFEVTGAKLEVVYEGDATAVAGTNGALHGTFVNMDQDALSAKATELSSDIYLLSGNQLWNVTTGGASGNSLAAGRAYIVYDELVDAAPQPAPGRRVRAIPMGQQTATGIDALNTSETPVKMIINGELFIIRGEKMYNANGQIVK